MLTVATLFWQPNKNSRDFSTMYSEEWVEKLYRGFARNLSKPFRFVCFTDRLRNFKEPIEQEPISASVPDYGTCIEPYALGVPMILVGLDTVVTGNVDHLAEFCLTSDRLALPRDPFHPKIACNGVALVPWGQGKIGRDHRGENDMEWVRKFPHHFIGDIWPGHVESYKGTVKRNGLGDTRIVYFHGKEKPHELPNVGWLKEHWI